MKRALTGIRPSGELHVGNYLGTIKPALSLQSEYECLYFIADLHALTTNKDARSLHQYSLDIAASWIALGLDTDKHIIYRQSDIPQVTEFAWYLSCVTGAGLIEKAHAYKDAVSQNKEVNFGVFAYPLLMAADILMYDADIVPVGKDQKQHVEMARDMAGSFNAAYQCEAIKLPAPLINEKVMTIPGLDGRKMSKSYNNVIPLFSEEKALRKKIMSIKTDSSDAEAPKELSGTLLGELFSVFAEQNEIADVEARLRKGGLGWGHAKEELFVLINKQLSESRQRYHALRSDEKKLEEILKRGMEKALAISKPILNRVRKTVGLSC